jgi:replication factor A1
LNLVKLAFLTSQKNKVFVIVKFDPIEKKAPLIGNPEVLRDDGSSNMNERESINNNPIQNKNVGQVNCKNLTVNVRNTTNDIKINSTDNNYNRNSTSEYENSRLNSNNFCMPLNVLTTFTKDIKIRIRVTKKTEVKEFGSQGRNPGKLFSFNILDNQGTEMQVTCFTKAVDKFFGIIHEKKMYYICGGYIKPSDKKYSNVKSEYRLVLDENANIEELEDDGTISENSFNFVKLADLNTIDTGRIVDVMVYVLESQEKIMKNTKYGEQALKKLMVADDSEYKIEVTLWKQHADLHVEPKTILCIKSAKVGDFNGKNLSTLDDTHIIAENLPYPQSNELINFIENYKGDWKTFNSLNSNNSNMDNMVNSNISRIKDVIGLLSNAIPDDQIPVSRIKGTVCNIAHTDKNFYAGCPEKNCKRKVVQETYTWRCTACDKTFPKPTYYYTLNLRLKDGSAEQYIDVFGDLGAKLLKISCDDYKDLIFNNDQVKLNEITKELEFKTFTFVGKAKMNLYNGIPKKKFNVYKVEPVDLSVEIKRLTRSLGTLLNINK